ncbi:MAG: tetratricopeptide repeat protein [bacterium]|nr:tetratricopeptide repeat protein [bacterium]
MDNSIHYWKEKLIIAASLIIFNFLIIAKLFYFIADTTLLFIGPQTNSIFQFFVYVLLTIFIPGIVISLGIFICILIYYIFIRSLWLIDAEDSNILGKRANDIYLFSFNVLTKILIFITLFSLVNVVLFIILGGELGYYRIYTFYLNNPNNLIYFVAFLITNLFFIESESILSKRLNLPAIFPSKRKEVEGKKININILFKYYFNNILLIVVINLILVTSIQFIGGMANQLNLKAQTISENGFSVDPLIKVEVAIKGVTNTGRENTIPIYLGRMNRLYQNAEQEFASGNYLTTINLLQKELDMNSNFSIAVYSDRMYPWLSKMLSNKISNSGLFLKDSLTDSLENIEYAEDVEKMGKDAELINKDKFKEYFFIPLAMNDELKINIWRNARGEYSQVFKKSELLNISRSHINKKIGDCFLLLGNYASAKDYYIQAVDKNSYYLEVKNNLGYIYMKENSFNKAEHEYKDILNIKPNYYLASINLGNLYLNNGQIDQASNILQTINLESGMSQKDKIFYYQVLAEVFYKKGEFNEAGKKYSKALKIDPYYYPASIGLARIYWEKGKFTAAKKIYENILKKYDIALAYIGMAKYYVQQKDNNKAMEFYNKAINLGNDYEAVREGFIGIGDLFAGKGNLTEAENYYNKAISIDPYNYSAYQKLGEIFFNAKKWESAKNNFLKAIEMFPQNEEVQKHLEVAYKNISKETQAKYEKIVEKEKAGKDKEKLIYSYKNLGWIHLGNGNYEGALKSFDQAIAVNPDYIEALQGKGMLFLKTEKYNEAEKIFQKIIGINKSYASAYVGLGIVNIKHNEINKAIENLEYVMKLNDADAKIQSCLELGGLYYGQGNYALARNKFLQANTFNKDIPEAYYGLGVIYEVKKLYNNAIIEFRKAIYLKPDYTQAKDGLKRVTSLILERTNKKVISSPENIEKENFYKTIEFAINKGELEKTQNSLLEILDETPADTKALKYLGLVYLQKKMFAESKKQWEKILNINSQDSEALNYIKMINEKLASAKISEEEYFIPLLSEGVSYYTKGEYENAKQKFLKANALNNTSAVVHKYLGKIYFKNKEYDNAISELKKSLELDPNQPEIENTLIKLHTGYTVFKGLD